MRVRLKGINSKRKQLSDGTVKTYWYAWKGGPRLDGDLGSPEFVAAYNAAAARKRQPPQGVLLSIMQGFQASDDFRSLAPRTRADYVKHVKAIEREFGDFPLGALTDRRTRGEFMAWRDRLAVSSRRQADYAWIVLARILSWALDRGLVLANPCARGGRLYRGTRADKAWTHDDEAAFLRAAPAHLHLPLILGLWTGQRRATSSGSRGRPTTAPHPPAAVEDRRAGRHPRRGTAQGRSRRHPEAQPRGPRELGRPALDRGWVPVLVAESLQVRRDRRLTFNDLRGAAVTRLAHAECTEAEIATITGHSLRDVQSILDAHYLNRDPALAESAIRKLETRTKTPDRAPDRA